MTNDHEELDVHLILKMADGSVEAGLLSRRIEHACSHFRWRIYPECWTRSPFGREDRNATRIAGRRCLDKALGNTQEGLSRAFHGQARLPTGQDQPLHLFHRGNRVADAGLGCGISPLSRARNHRNTTTCCSEFPTAGTVHMIAKYSSDMG
jgi:hypothetical protein